MEVVIQYGIVQKQTDGWQRAGRAGRTPGMWAIFLILYEPWVLDIDLSEILETLNDPDQPVGKITKFSSKQARTGVESIRMIQLDICLRRLQAKYLDDKTPEGEHYIYR